MKEHAKQVEGGAQNLGQKSLQLYRYILEKMTTPSSLVIELFAGTATMCRAALASKRNCISVELLASECKKAQSMFDNFRHSLHSSNLPLEPVQRPFISFKFHNELKALYERLQMEEQSAKKQAEPNSPVLQAETVTHSTMTANEIKDFIEKERSQEELGAVLEDLKKQLDECPVHEAVEGVCCLCKKKSKNLAVKCEICEHKIHKKCSLGFGENFVCKDKHCVLAIQINSLTPKIVIPATQ